MAESAARLLALLTLLQTRPRWPGAELAGRLEVTGRTLRRDVDRLRELGYPIQAERGPAGGYRLGSGGRLPPLLLSDDEALAAAIALRAVACGDVGTLAEPAGNALMKLEQVMPERLRRKINAVSRVAIALPGALAGTDPEIFSRLTLACHRAHRVRFGYTDHHQHDSQRHVEPYRLVHSGRYWYLAAHDLDRQAWRVFRLDRIRDITDTAIRFTLDTAPDAVDLVARAVSSGPYVHEAGVLLHVSAERAAHDFPPTTGTITAIDDHSCLLTISAVSIDAIAIHLGLLDYDFTVQAPRQLHARIHQLAQRFHQAARQQEPA